VADAVLRSDRFPVGNTVNAYPASNWNHWQLPPTGNPVGSSAGSGVVASDGSVTIAGLRAKTEYFAHTDVGGDDRYVRFRATGEGKDDDDIGRAQISAASIGDNTVVAAIPGKRIKVIGYALVSTSANTIRWKSGAAANLSGAMALAANGGLSSPSDKNTVEFETAVGEALVLNLTGATNVGGHVVYKVE